MKKEAVVPKERELSVTGPYSVNYPWPFIKFTFQ